VTPSGDELPGVLGVGDVRSGSVKRVASAVGGDRDCEASGDGAALNAKQAERIIGRPDPCMPDAYEDG
jgi:hypothetical protein